MQLQFAPSPYSRTTAGAPEQRLVNLYFETTPQGPKPSVLIQRPTLELALTVGAGPIRAMAQEPSALGGGLFTVSGNKLYSITTEKGTIGSSTGVLSTAISDAHLVIADPSDGKAYSFDGTTFAEITDADLPNVSDVAYFQGRWYFPESGKGIFWFSAVGDPTSVDGLGFMAAESSPDKIVKVIPLGDELVFFGQSTTEFHFPTGDADAPLQRGQGRTYSRGCIAAGSVVAMDNSLFWVGDDLIPYRTGNTPVPLINPATGDGYGVVDRLRRTPSPSSITAWHTTIEGHAFYVLNIPQQGTFAFDVTTQRWSQWTSPAENQFRVAFSRFSDGNTFMGDYETGKVYRWNFDDHEDDGETVECIASAFVGIPSGAERVDNVALELHVASARTVEMRRWNRGTWGDWEERTTSSDGRAVWRRLGLVRSPGTYVEFKVDDAALATFSGVTMNEVRP